MKVVLSLILFMPIICLSQIPKRANTIIIKGPTFKEVATALLDAGYTIEKSDSSLQTIKTEWKDGTGKDKLVRLRLYARIKDSSAIIRGEYYPPGPIGTKFLGQEQTIENSTYKIENTSGLPKNSFNEMNDFALSFKKPVEYIIQ